MLGVRPLERPFFNTVLSPNVDHVILGTLPLYIKIASIIIKMLFAMTAMMVYPRPTNTHPCSKMVKILGLSFCLLLSNA